MASRTSIYVDESGDLGPIERGGTRHFAVSALATDDPVSISRIPRRTRRRLQIRGTYGELKFNSSSARVRRHVLEQIAAEDCVVSWCALRKSSHLFSRAIGMGTAFHLSLGRALLPIAASTTSTEVHVTLDKRNEAWFRKMDVETSVKDFISGPHRGHFPPEVRICFRESHNDGCLQAADFISGAVFQMVEREDSTYFDIVRHLTIGAETIPLQKECRPRTEF